MAVFLILSVEKTPLRLNLTRSRDKRHILLELGTEPIVDPMGRRLLPLMQVIE